MFNIIKKKDEKKFYLFLLSFPVLYYIYFILIKGKSFNRTLLSSDIYNVFIVLILMGLSSFFIKNKKIKKSIEDASISTIIAFFAYHDLVFTTFYFVFLLSYFYGVDSIY